MKIFISFILVLIFSYGVGHWLNLQKAQDIESIVAHSSCDPVKEYCEINNGNERYRLKFIGIPSALVPFVVSVEIEGEPPQSIELVFEMSGMDMGFNQYALIDHETNWQAKVILPVCSLARSDWVLNVMMKHENIESVTAFRFSL